MQTARLSEIVRQKDPAFEDIVEQLACGNVWDAVNALAVGLDSKVRALEVAEREMASAAQPTSANDFDTLICHCADGHRFIMSSRAEHFREPLVGLAKASGIDFEATPLGLS